MKDFDLSDAMDAPRAAWCIGCNAPVKLNDEGRCPECADSASPEDIAILEPLPPTSPRTIECPTCGEDRGFYCLLDEDGNGYNHVARVERFERERGVLS